MKITKHQEHYTRLSTGLHHCTCLLVTTIGPMVQSLGRCTFWSQVRTSLVCAKARDTRQGRSNLQRTPVVDDWLTGCHRYLPRYHLDTGKNGQRSSGQSWMQVRYQEATSLHIVFLIGTTSHFITSPLHSQIFVQSILPFRYAEKAVITTMTVSSIRCNSVISRRKSGSGDNLCRLHAVYASLIMQ